MKKFLFGPITKMLDERAQGVADTIDQADARLAEAKQCQVQYEQQLADAREEAARILAAARQRGENDYARRMAEAEQALSASTSRPRASVRPTAPPCWPTPKSRLPPWS